jgi:hypothetical protein
MPLSAAIFAFIGAGYLYNSEGHMPQKIILSK